MQFPKEGYLLRIFIGESDKHEGKPLYEWIVIKAHESKLAGATVLRGLMGFGANSRLRYANVLRLSLDLPIVIEVIDDLEKIEAFLPMIEPTIECGLITLERVRIKRFSKTENETGVPNKGDKN